MDSTSPPAGSPRPSRPTILSRRPTPADRPRSASWSVARSRRRRRPRRSDRAAGDRRLLDAHSSRARRWRHRSERPRRRRSTRARARQSCSPRPSGAGSGSPGRESHSHRGGTGRAPSHPHGARCGGCLDPAGYRRRRPVLEPGVVALAGEMSVDAVPGQDLSACRRQTDRLGEVALLGVVDEDRPVALEQLRGVGRGVGARRQRGDGQRREAEREPGSTTCSRYATESRGGGSFRRAYFASATIVLTLAVTPPEISTSTM